MHKRRTDRLLLVFLLLLVSFTTGTTALADEGKPAVAASFTFSPPAPLIDEPVTFTSTSTTVGRDNELKKHDWDLDADGGFDDATGPVVQRTFQTAGNHIVSLRVIDKHQNNAETSQTVVVSARVPTPAPRQLLTPFPIVHMSGSVSRGGTRLWRFSVEAPDGATVRVRCRGRSCPMRRQSRTASVDFEATGRGLKLIRFRRLERRLLGRGVVVKVFVTRSGAVGKYVRFKMRRNKPPLRADRCVLAGTTVPMACPPQ